MCKMLDLEARQSLSQYVSDLVFGWAVNELDGAGVDYVTNKMVPNIDMFGSRVILSRLPA